MSASAAAAPNRPADALPLTACTNHRPASASTPASNVCPKNGTAALPIPRASAAASLSLTVDGRQKRNITANPTSDASALPMSAPGTEKPRHTRKAIAVNFAVEYTNIPNAWRPK